MPVIISTFLKCHQDCVLRCHTGASPLEQVQSLNQQPPMDVPETSALLDKVWEQCLHSYVVIWDLLSRPGGGDYGMVGWWY